MKITFVISIVTGLIIGVVSGVHSIGTQSLIEIEKLRTDINKKNQTLKTQQETTQTSKKLVEDFCKTYVN